MHTIKCKTNFLKSGLSAAILFGFLGWAEAESSDVTAEYMNKALQGDLSTAEETLVGHSGNQEATELLKKFRARFIDRTDGLDLDDEDPLVQEVGGIVEEYWRNAMLNPSERRLHERTFFQGVMAAIQNSEFASPDLNPGNLESELAKIFEEKGYYSRLGRTAPLFDFLIWKKNDQNLVSVDLTDGSYEVQINFLNEFVSLGWSSFATFGGPSAAGWADENGLFVVTEKWDLESENFQVSFLKHETRHFADYKLYPELKGADLEYRAKLTELAFAEETVFDLLQKFTHHAARIENAPHPLANWHVITDMSGELLGTEWPTGPDGWENIPVGEIQAAAKKLLQRHDQALAKVGAKNTAGIITP